jgi:plastocyanin
MPILQFACCLIFLTFSILSFSDRVQAEEYKIGMEGWEFSPASLTIKAGDVVTWVNDDDTNHNIAFEVEFNGAPTREEPVKVRTTKEYSVVFKNTGTFHYFCKIHEDYDMKGTIVVE